MRNLLVVFLLLISIFPKLNKSMEIWKDKNYNILDYDDSNNLDETECFDNEICQNNFQDKVLDNFVKRKLKENDPSILPAMTDGKRSRLVPYYHSAHPMPCSCGIEFRPRDLGRSYYPRYIYTGVCKSEGCGGLYRCMERQYKVRVLKQRDPRNSDAKTSTTLPENLKESWQPEVITVTVACECSL